MKFTFLLIICSGLIYSVTAEEQRGILHVHHSRSSCNDHYWFCCNYKYRLNPVALPKYVIKFSIISVAAAFSTGIVRDMPSRASFDASPSCSAAHNYGAILFFMMDISLFVGVAAITIVPALQVCGI
jgi:hypothetical protein